MTSDIISQAAVILAVIAWVGALALISVLRIRHARDELDRSDLSKMELVKSKFVLGSNTVMLVLFVLIVLLFLFKC